MFIKYFVVLLKYLLLWPGNAGLHWTKVLFVFSTMWWFVSKDINKPLCSCCVYRSLCLCFSFFAYCSYVLNMCFCVANTVKPWTEALSFYQYMLFWLQPVSGTWLLSEPVIGVNFLFILWYVSTALTDWTLACRGHFYWARMQPVFQFVTGFTVPLIVTVTIVYWQLIPFTCFW